MVGTPKEAPSGQASLVGLKGFMDLSACRQRRGLRPGVLDPCSPDDYAIIARRISFEVHCMNFLRNPTSFSSLSIFAPSSVCDTHGQWLSSAIIAAGSGGTWIKAKLPRQDPRGCATVLLARPRNRSQNRYGDADALRLSSARGWLLEIFDGESCSSPL